MKTKTIKIKKKRCLFSSPEYGGCIVMANNRIPTKSRDACPEYKYETDENDIILNSRTEPNKNCPFNEYDQIIFEVE